MLSLFPQILFLAPVSAFLIRISLAVLFASASWRHASQRTLSVKVFAILEIALAAMLCAGVWTQAVALGAAILLIASLTIPQFRISARSTTLMSFILCISLLVTGAGAFAFDLPL